MIDDYKVVMTSDGFICAVGASQAAGTYVREI